MAPKVRTTREDIVNKAVELVRQGGVQALNARAIAAALNCSTQPIFSNFNSMEELQEATLEAAYKIYLGMLDREYESGKYPKYKSFGMAYIRFAKEEKELFKLLFMRNRTGEDLILTPDFDESVDIIMQANGLPREKALLIHLEMWAFVHGIGTMFATSFLDLEWDLVSNMLTDIYQGVRAGHEAKEQ